MQGKVSRQRKQSLGHSSNIYLLHPKQTHKAETSRVILFHISSICSKICSERKIREIGIRLGVPKRNFSTILGLLLPKLVTYRLLICSLAQTYSCTASSIFGCSFTQLLRGQSSSSLYAAWMLFQLKPGFAYRYQPRMPPVCRF